MESGSDGEKRRGRPQTGIGPAIGLRLYPELEARLDAYIAAQAEPRPSRPEAIRALLQEALAAKGLLDVVDAETAIDNRIDALEATVASIPAQGDPSPQTGMNTMKRALAEAQLIGLRQTRKRVRKAKPT